MHFQYNRTVPMKPWQGILISSIFVIVGIIVLFFSVKNIKTYNEKKATFTEATAKVIDYAHDDEGLQAIIVEYNINGVTYKKQSNVYSNMPKSIGTEVGIYYNPNNPADAIWKNDSTNIIMPLLGGIFTVVGLIAMFFSVKQNKSDIQPTDNIEVNNQNNSFGMEQNNNENSNLQEQPQSTTPIMNNGNEAQQSINQETNSNENSNMF